MIIRIIIGRWSGLRPTIPWFTLEADPPLIPRTIAVDMQEFLKNRIEFPLEELAQYAGKYIAWAADGNSIIASDEDPLTLMATLDGRGIDRGETVISYIPEEDGRLILAAVEA
jgi:hypothetical protein